MIKKRKKKKKILNLCNKKNYLQYNNEIFGKKKMCKRPNIIGII
jgi:hypothetical protein